MTSQYKCSISLLNGHKLSESLSKEEMNVSKNAKKQQT